MPPAENFQEFLRTLADLREAVADRALVLVEGERDRRALATLGVPLSSVHLVHQGLSLPRLAERIVHRSPSRVILLTDWDGKGGHLANRLRLLFEDGRLKPDGSFRRRFALTVREGGIRCVEDLASWAERESRLSGAPLEHFLSTLPKGEGGRRETPV